MLGSVFGWVCREVMRATLGAMMYFTVEKMIKMR